MIKNVTTYNQRATELNITDNIHGSRCKHVVIFRMVSMSTYLRLCVKFHTKRWCTLYWTCVWNENCHTPNRQCQSNLCFACLTPLYNVSKDYVNLSSVYFRPPRWHIISSIYLYARVCIHNEPVCNNIPTHPHAFYIYMLIYVRGLFRSGAFRM